MILLKCPKCLHHWKMERDLLKREVLVSCPHCSARWKITPKAPKAHKAVLADAKRPFRENLARTLTSMGFEITLVEDGEKLIETLRSKPDLVIANVFLPGKLGVEACEWMKAQPDLHYIPFILIGSLFRVERYRRPANSLYGADDYIEEGIPNDEFRGIVHRLTGFGVSGHGAVQSPLEEHLRRKVRIHLDTMTGGDRIQGPMGPRIKELVSAIIKDSPNTDPALVEKIAGEYLTGMEGDHDRDQ